MRLAAGIDLSFVQTRVAAITEYHRASTRGAKIALDSPTRQTLIISGVLKIAYDLALLYSFRHIKPPEEGDAGNAADESRVASHAPARPS